MHHHLVAAGTENGNLPMVNETGVVQLGMELEPVSQPSLEGKQHENLPALEQNLEGSHMRTFQPWNRTWRGSHMRTSQLWSSMELWLTTTTIITTCIQGE